MNYKHSAAVKSGLTKRRIKQWQRRMGYKLVAITFIMFALSILWCSFELQNSLQPLIQTVKADEQVEKPKKQSLGISTVTMYTSRPEETDASPCIDSNGQDICVLWQKGQKTCATNWVDLGSVLEVEGLGECLVTGRMNKRYHTEVDWYNGYDDECLDGYDQYDICPQLKEALEFGAKKREIYLL